MQPRIILKRLLPPILLDDVHPFQKPQNLRDRSFYTPLFSPWKGFGEFRAVMAAVSPYSLVSAEKVWVSYVLAQQACHLPGDFWECGVYRGGTAIMLASVVASARGKRLHLFDTFSGMPEVDPLYDNYHNGGDFSDASLETVQAHVGTHPHIVYHAGFIPDTFVGMEAERIAFAHVGVDIYQSVTDCSAVIYPRLSGGGFIVFDDYGAPTCAGARAAVDEFFADKPECPLALPTGQALVIKLPDHREAQNDEDHRLS